MAEVAKSVTFTEKEVEFLMESKLARLATSSPDGQPHVVPVVYEFDGQALYFSGWNLQKSLKFKNLFRNRKVALAIDDLVSVKPWRPRGIEIRGTAEIVETEDSLYVKVVPSRKVSWGL
jgi:pyridoxamine 5'-phosphate oxidase family protein